MATQAKVDNLLIKLSHIIIHWLIRVGWSIFVVWFIWHFGTYFILCTTLCTPRRKIRSVSKRDDEELEVTLTSLFIIRQLNLAKSSFPNYNWTKTERQMGSSLTDSSRGTGVVERNRKRKKEHGRTVEKFRSCQEITSHRPLSRPVFRFQLSSHRLYYLGDAQSRAVVSRNGDQTTRSWIGDGFFL